MRKTTPLREIRKRCVDCSGGELKRVKECEFGGEREEECPFYPLRMGRGSRKTLRRIRKYCLWCCCYQKHEVKLCPVVKCSLWEYRFGKRPKSLNLPEIVVREGVLETIGA
jgi:hypothetical protein